MGVSEMMPHPAPIIDAVVCNFNQAQWLPASLRRLISQSARLRRIHIVDNASADDSLAVVHHTMNDSPVPFIIHRMDENLGGAGGFAFGTAAAMNDHPDFILLLDGDAFLDEHAVEILAQYALSQSRVAVVGPKIYLAPKNATSGNNVCSGRIIQEIGGQLDWEKAEFVLCHRGRDENDLPALTGAFKVDYVAACTCLVRCEAVARCGTMDSSFFLYWDDIDWCARMRAAGYRIDALADAVAWHVGGGRVRSSLMPTYFHWRNMVRFFGSHREEKPETQALETALFQGLRAAFTCRLFGQNKTAAIIEQALEHGWMDRRGPLDFPGAQLQTEPVQRRVEPKRINDGLHWIEGLPHLLEVPINISTFDLKQTVLSDRFGKEMRLDDALAARKEFSQWYPKRLAQLQRLPGAWI
jgi:GT2 family glycosyltransferase